MCLSAGPGVATTVIAEVHLNPRKYVMAVGQVASNIALVDGFMAQTRKKTMNFQWTSQFYQKHSGPTDRPTDQPTDRNALL